MNERGAVSSKRSSSAQAARVHCLVDRLRTGALFAAFTLVAGIVWSGFSAPSVAADKPDETLAADLAMAQKLLESNGFAEFIEKFAPVETLRRIRQADAMDQAAKEFSQRPENVKKLLDLIRDLKKSKARFDKSGGYATFEIQPAAEPDEPVVPATPPKVAPPPAGLGGDLKKALSEAQHLFDAGDYGAFATKFFAAPEASRLRNPDEQAAFVARMKQLPEVTKKMAADLKALQSAAPKLSDGGSVAEFELKGAEFELKGAGAAARTIRLQKVGGDWRLYDGSAAVKKEIDAAAKAKPAVLAQPARVRAEMEKVGGNWRFVEFKF